MKVDLLITRVLSIALVLILIILISGGGEAAQKKQRDDDASIETRAARHAAEATSFLSYLKLLDSDPRSFANEELRSVSFYLLHKKAATTHLPSRKPSDEQKQSTCETL